MMLFLLLSRLFCELLDCLRKEKEEFLELAEDARNDAKDGGSGNVARRPVRADKMAPAMVPMMTHVVVMNIYMMS